MKVELTREGYIKVTAETIVEGWALNNIWPLPMNVMDRERNEDRVIIDCRVLTDARENKE